MKTPIQELIEKVEHAIAYNLEGANVKKYTWEDLHFDMYNLLEKEKQVIINAANNKLYTLLPTVLDEMIEYIEETDQQIEWEWGSCRGLQEVKDAKEMPDIYYKLISLKNGG